ncbi:hypothetical protein G6011_07990 [Alternaria panax]|uniref:Uncharacterized protein n=1 Tax=Alternaria panax TaxID=48097 RepID=A0AAD4F9T0_9PLEO|nr:hypothetical protein G6011_07990 [Alternaria panax]
MCAKIADLGSLRGYHQEIVFINATSRPTEPQIKLKDESREPPVHEKDVLSAYIIEESQPALCSLSNLFDEATTPPEKSLYELENDVNFIVQHFAPICGEAPAEFNLYHNQICGAWVEILPLVVEPAKNNPLLYSSIRTMATALRNHASAARGNGFRILLMYGDCLRQIVIPEARSDWTTHAKGVGAMIERLGPKPFSNGILHTLFVGFRPLLLINAIHSRRKTFLAREEWAAIPFQERPVSILQLLFNKATRLPALLEMYDSLRDRYNPSKLVAMQQLRNGFLYMIKCLENWEFKAKAQANFSLVWPKPDSPSTEPCDGKPLWFANVLVASSLTHCWAFEIIARSHLNDIEEVIAAIEDCKPKATPRRSGSADDKGEHPVSVLAEKICDSMQYFLQPELKLYGPASTFFTFLTAMKVFKHKRTYCASRLSHCQQVLNRLASIGIHFPPP